MGARKFGNILDPESEVSLTVLQGAEVRQVKVKAVDRMKTMRRPSGEIVGSVFSGLPNRTWRGTRGAVMGPASQTPGKVADVPNRGRTV